MLFPLLARRGFLSRASIEPLEARLAPAVVAGADAAALSAREGFHIIDSAAAAVAFPLFSMSHVGDFDGDGVDDLLLLRFYNVEDSDGNYIDHRDAFLVY